MDFLKFLLTKVFFRNLSIALGLIVTIIFSSLVWLNIYTHHGQALTVPDLTGLNQEEVEMVISAKKLRFIITDSIFFRELPKGTVVRQNPMPGSRVKVRRTVYLTMNAMNPEKIPMPAITGVSLRQARAILETYGLQLGKITTRPDIAVGVVLGQSHSGAEILPGEMIVKGSVVDLILGRGLSDETTAVPDLTGQTFPYAKDMLADRFLNIGAIIYDSTVITGEDTSKSFIWQQRPRNDPESDTEIRLQLGSNVDIWLTIDSMRLPKPDTLIEQKDIIINGQNR